MMERLASDVATALRALKRTPVPVAAAILTLAVAVGVNLAMFGLIDRALLSPPAHVADPVRLFTLAFGVPGESAGAAAMTTAPYPTFVSIQDEVPALAGAAAFQRVATSMVVEGEQRSVNAMLVSGHYFAVLGARPLLGRGIDAADDEAGAAAPAAVLSHGFWSAAFRADAGVLGRRIIVRGLEYSVAGVMPRGFSGHSTAGVDLFVPFAAAMRNTPGWDRSPFRNVAGVVARLADGQNPAAAAAQAGEVTGRRVALAAIAGAAVAAPERRVAWWLAGVSVLVLVIGLANAATLLVVRGARLRHDVAVRAALGASRGRLVTQALLEAVILALAATGASLVLASWMDEAVRRVLFPGVLAQAGFGGVTWWTAATAGVLAAGVAAAANLWQLPRAFESRHLAALTPGGQPRTRTLSALLVLQTSVSVVLLAGAGLFGASLYRLWAQDFGMQMDRVVVVNFDPGPDRVANQDEVFSSALERIRQLPGVDLATVIDSMPFTGFNVPPIAVPGRAESPAVGQQLPYLTAVTPEFLQILGIQLVEGRALTEADDRGAPVVMVNQSMARAVWPGESALGKCIRIGFDPDFDPASFDPAFGPPMPTKVPCREVVGVTRDVRQRSVLPFDNEDRWLQYFVPFSQVPKPPFVNDPEHIRGLLLRASGSLDALAPAVRRLVVGDRTDLPFVRVRPYAELLERQMRPWSMGTTLLGLFSALALAVAAVGLYAAFAYAVSERRREMAIRMAVGARPAGVLALVLREALTLAAAGAVFGCGVAVLAGQWVQSLLFGTTASDPLVLTLAAGAMLVVAAAATVVPARAAAQADPSVLLRAE